MFLIVCIAILFGIILLYVNLYTYITNNESFSNNKCNNRCTDVFTDRYIYNNYPYVEYENIKKIRNYHDIIGY